MNIIWCTCDYGYTDINGVCYFQEDLEVLQEFINNSMII